MNETFCFKKDQVNHYYQVIDSKLFKNTSIFSIVRFNIKKLRIIYFYFVKIKLIFFANSKNLNYQKYQEIKLAHLFDSERLRCHYF